MSEEAKKPDQQQVNSAAKGPEPVKKDTSAEAKTQAEQAQPEEKKQKPTQEKKAEEKKAQDTPAVASQVEVAEKKEDSTKKKKKINRLTLKELDRRIKEVQEKMGGLTSTYAQQLLKRKEQLLESTEYRVQSTEEKKPGKHNAI